MSKRSWDPAGRPSGEAEGWLGVQRPQRGRPWWTRMGWISTLILSLGGLATAITAILSLLPSPDPEDSARFTSLRVTPQVPLSEYHLRTVGALDGPELRLVAAQVPTPSALQSETRTASPTAEPSPSDSPTADPFRSDSATTTPGPTETSSQPEAAQLLEVSRGVIVETRRPAAELQEVAFLVLDRSGLHELCDATACVTHMQQTFWSLANAVREGATPAEAAEHVLALFEEVRTIPSPVAPPDPGAAPPAVPEPAGTLVAEPVGMVVDLDMELVGLRGRPVLLTWSLWRQGGDSRLFGQWLKTNPAYRLTPPSHRYTESLELWVPLPKDPGPYFVRVALAVDGVRIASQDSDLVH